MPEIDAPRNENCAYCESPITLRTTGGVPQRFCTHAGRRCRHAYRQALVAFAEEQVANGRVTVAELKAALIRKQPQNSLKLGIENEA